MSSSISNISLKSAQWKLTLLKEILLVSKIVRKQIKFKIVRATLFSFRFGAQALCLAQMFGFIDAPYNCTVELGHISSVVFVCSVMGITTVGFHLCPIIFVSYDQSFRLLASDLQPGKGTLQSPYARPARETL